ncbi:peptidase M48-like protein [Pontibacter ummariensis]|uniref:Peptidase family M48 n=1 Tax=Pontibacter ummariensis TaxID=1610492 RepID=A0A239FWJ4_9BACT|nr:M48 family metallopeptidase [Pontibacter ummariensis]PRY11929.1 peptidase M48-like protein [Pontibacter ummariensis]SNS60194.1 Peptidase family M48 [Pontibacter ummariensis]
MSGVIKFIIALLMAAVSLVTYWCTTEENEFTGEEQHVDMTVEQEIALGLQAAPEMAQQYGGLHPDREAAAKVQEVGQRLVQNTRVRNSPYHFEFHLLADEQTVNAFALPGGQVFITAGLLERLESEEQLAGVLAHEIGHVVARHSAQQLAKAKLTESLSGAAAIATYDPENPSSRAGAAVAAMVGRLVNMRYGREDELESDRLAVQLTGEAGYDPRAMIAVLRILEQANRGAGGPEFLQTHPNPGNRVAQLEQVIREEYPNGLPQ